MDQLRDGHAARLRHRTASCGHAVLKDFLAAKRVVLKENQVFVVSGRNGAMHHESPDGHGVWMDDTRYLSDYKVLVNGVEPEATGLSADGGVLVFELTSGPLHIHLKRYLTGGLHDRFTFSNPGTTSYGANVDLMFAADFAAMLRVRGILPASAPQAVVEVPGWQGFVLREAASETHVTQVTVVPDGRHRRIELEPGQQFLLRVDVIPRGS